MSSVPEIKKAFEIANIANMNASELEDLEKREIYIHDQRNALKKAEKKAKKEGREIGLKEGKEIGMKEGREIGIQEGQEIGMKTSQEEIAKRLLDVLDEETISLTTGLSLEDVQKLKLD